MQNAGLDEAQAGVKIAGKRSIMSDMQMSPPLMAESEESDRGEWKSCVKLNIEKTKIIASGPITSLQMEKQWKQYETLCFWAPKSLQIATAVMKLEDTRSLEEKLWET